MHDSIELDSTQHVEGMHSDEIFPGQVKKRCETHTKNFFLIVCHFEACKHVSMRKA